MPRSSPNHGTQRLPNAAKRVMNLSAARWQVAILALSCKRKQRYIKINLLLLLLLLLYEGSPVDVIYLDFQKAFDKVPHQRLILKLKSHGMGNSIINWIERWLKDRRQMVVVDGEVSSWKPVLSGVPLGKT